MIRLIKKYTILIAASIILVHFLTVLILTIFPDLLTVEISEMSTFTIGTGYLKCGIEYLLNIVLVVILYKDMTRENIQSIPILIVTFFSNLVGILLFFLIITSKTLNYKNKFV
jgi:hypothetical protein